MNVLVASLSRSFVRHFLSFLLLQLHLVVVYSDVAAGALSSTAVQYSATAQSLVRRHCGSLPQPGLLTPRKLSGMLCHRVVFDPCVSLFSVIEGRSRSLSLCSISSTASLFRGSPIPLRSQPVDSCVDTHAPLRGPLVHPALLAGLRVSRIATVTRYFPSHLQMTRVSLLHAGTTRYCEFCCAQSFFWVC